MVMKATLYSTALAVSVFALCSFSHDAKATVVVLSQDISTLPLVNFDTPATASSGSATFTQSQIGSVTDDYLSPYVSSAALADTQPYSVISPSGVGPGSATYNLNGAAALSLLWGSPDSYNFIDFYSGADASGTFLGAIQGNDLTLATPGSGFDLVTLGVGGPIGSVYLADSGTAAFEYGDLQGIAATPLPASLPLFAAGLGLMGFFALRRKSRVASSSIAAA
jgi:hypothetical protein